METISIICTTLVGPSIICHGVSPEVLGDNSTFRQVGFEKRHPAGIHNEDLT